MSWSDFNNADDQTSFDLIHKGTLVKVRMTCFLGHILL